MGRVGPCGSFDGAGASSSLEQLMALFPVRSPPDRHQPNSRLSMTRKNNFVASLGAANQLG